MNEEFINSLTWLLATTSKCLVGDCLDQNLLAQQRFIKAQRLTIVALAAKYDF
jgi:hypothetical protein